MKNFKNIFFIIGMILSFASNAQDYTYSASPSIGSYHSSCPDGGNCTGWSGNTVDMQVLSATSTTITIRLHKCDNSNFSGNGTFYVGSDVDMNCSNPETSYYAKLDITGPTYYTYYDLPISVTWSDFGFNWIGVFKSSASGTLYDAGAVNITRTPVKPDVTTNSATNISENSATLNATINTHGHNCAYAFQYGTTDSYGNNTSSTSVGSTGSSVPVSADISGLLPNTTYHFRCISNNDGGLTQGNDMTFTTSNNPTPSISLSGNLSFGNVQVGSTATSNLTITNTGNATLSVTSISYPTGFSGNWSGNISAGSSHAVTVTFAPTQAITYNGNVTVNSNASGTNTISISGTGTSAPCPPPTAQFTVDNTNNEALVYQFTDNSQAGTGEAITNWTWNFGDGNTNNTQSPSHTYSNGGNYNVSLTVTNSCGGQNQITINNCVSDLGFRPDPDGFSFSNASVRPDVFEIPQNDCNSINSIWNENRERCEARSPSWENYQDAFGSNINNTNREQHLLYWASLARSPWGGSCFGFTVNSLLFFDNYLDYNNVYPQNSYNVTFDVDVEFGKDTINKYFIYQFGDVYRTHRNTVRNNTPTETLEAIRNSFENQTDNLGLAIFYTRAGANRSFGHSILPYKIIQNPDNENDQFLYVYDNNSPNNFERIITINTQSDTWSYGNVIPIRMYQGNSIQDYTNDAIRNFNTNNKTYNYFEVYPDYSFDINILNSSNQNIGFSNNTLYENESIGYPVIMFGDSLFNDRPLGYEVVPDEYSINLNNFSVDSCEIVFFGSSSTIKYKRNNVYNSENDIIKINNNSVYAINENTTDKNFQITSIKSAVNSERIYHVNNCSISQDDTISFSYDIDNNFDIVNFGTTNTYDLKITLSSDNKINFSHTNITLPPNSSHKVVPNWDNLANEDVVIYVDWQRDGSINDTLFIENQTTRIKDNIIIKDDITIYPNPATDIITVTLNNIENQTIEFKMLNYLGKEVAINYNKKSSNEIEINTSYLNQGIYFIQIITDKQKIVTKKVIIMK